jgi:hypothetical protein
MEFFATARLVASPDQLRDRITGPRLAEHCAAIDRVLEWRDDLDVGEIDCLWGQFAVRRELIRDGVRFTLPGCPNALAWTVTAASGGVLVHCTINRARSGLHRVDPDVRRGLAGGAGASGVVRVRSERLPRRHACISS